MTQVKVSAPIAAQRPRQVESPNGARSDPYYWLRDDLRKDPAVLAHLNAENAYTDQVMAPIKALQEKLYGEMLARLKQDDDSVPYRKQGYWYFTRFESGKEYALYFRKKAASGQVAASSSADELLLDSNALAAGKDFFQLGDMQVSPDNQLLAWTDDTVGRRQYTVHVRNLITGETLNDSITNVEADIVWAGDNRTFLYIAKDPVTLLGDKVRKHRLGDSVRRDPLIYEERDKSFYTALSRTKDDLYALILSDSTVSTEVRAAKIADQTLAFKVLIPRERDHEYQAEHLDKKWILRTNWQAKNFRIVEVDEGQVAARNTWRDVVAHRDDALVDRFDVFRDFLAVGEHSGGLANIRIVHWKDRRAAVIASDEAAYTTGLGQNEELDSSLLRYTYTSLTTPTTTYDYEAATGAKTLLKREPVLGGFDSANYVTEHVWATARDGTKLPISLVYRKGLPRDSSAPLLQFGYGSYGTNANPVFNSTLVSLLDRGFVYAIAHIRGGQEMGRAWYENGKLLSKRNTFTDFVDVTNYLVAQRYVDAKRSFAMGRSAGGLLMGAVANMAPSQYRGIVAQVPFVDVVTTMLDESIPLTTNEFDEWGNPKQKAYYDYMLSYSPYDNVTAQAYPAFFVDAGLWDSQVQYYEPAKWVAKLRQLKTDHNPLVFRINMEAGHGGKSGRFTRYREMAEYYAFLLDLAGIRT